MRRPEGQRAEVVRTVAGPGEHTSEVRKSRFLCALSRAEGEEQAREFVRQVRGRHWNATHNCYAYIVGEGGRARKSSDDGEPGGTAGAPMLAVLRRNDLTDTVAVVTRWFGGEKLGAGGLIRAYGSAVSQALATVGVVELRPVALMTVAAGHGLAGRLGRDMRAAGHEVRDERYGADHVVFELGVPESGVERFRVWLAEATAGVTSTQVTGRTYREVRVDG